MARVLPRRRHKYSYGRPPKPLGMDEAFVIRGQIALSCKGSHVVLHAAEKKAAAMGIPMCIAVVDAGGSLLAFTRQDGCRIASIEISMTKAISAATRKRKTVEDIADDPIRAIRLAMAAGGTITSIGGGTPIVVDGQVVGAVGVSGGTSEEDMVVGQAGIDAFLSG